MLIPVHFDNNANTCPYCWTSGGLEINNVNTCPFCWTSGGLETEVDGTAGAGDASLVTLCVSCAAVSASYCDKLHLYNQSAF